MAEQRNYKTARHHDERVLSLSGIKSLEDIDDATQISFGDWNESRYWRAKSVLEKLGVFLRTPFEFSGFIFKYLSDASKESKNSEQYPRPFKQA